MTGLIVVGAVNPSGDNESFAEATAAVSQKLGWPILSDVLNPLRSFLDETQALICHYDSLLRHRETAEKLKPSAILQIGHRSSDRKMPSCS